MKTRIILLFTLLLVVNMILIAQAPEWQWATHAGGIWGDYGYEITIDNAGNCYVTGYFSQIATFGSYSLTSSGVGDIFVAKMDADGNWLWATQAGGTNHDIGRGITIDNAGNCYVTGYFTQIATFGSYSLTSNAGDIFVAKIDAEGNWLWATQAGGSSTDYGHGITIDEAENCYVTGSFRNTATFGSFTLTSNGWGDMYVAKIDADGYWQWATCAGGTGADGGYGITIDDTGNSYVTGYFQETATFGSYTLTSSGNSDIFIAKIDANGNLLWATQAGGSNIDEGNAITIDDTGNSYVTGSFYGTATFGSYFLTIIGGYDIFVAKINAEGNWLWATKAGGTNLDRGHGITIDTAGNSYVTGIYYETATFGSYSLTNSGGSDIFVAKMDAYGNWLWATKAGGIWNDYGHGITIDDAMNCYVTGWFVETAFFGSYYLTSNGGLDLDIFVAKLNSSVFAENEIIPIEMELSNYPNPFNPSTTISFSLTAKDAKNAKIEIYNLKGQKIKTFPIPNSSLLIPNQVVWDGKDDNNQPVGSGIYFYKLTSGKFEESRKMILIK